MKIGWSMHYIQLSKACKHTSYLDKFGEQLEKDWQDHDENSDPQNGH